MLIRWIGAETQHMQKALALMNVRLDTVITDITARQARLSSRISSTVTVIPKSWPSTEIHAADLPNARSKQH